MQLEKTNRNQFYCTFQQDDKESSVCHALWNISELVMKIFSYLKVLDLINLSQTCKGLNSIASDNYLWKNFITKKIKNKFPEKKMREIYSNQFKKLKECNLQNIKDFGIEGQNKIFVNKAKDEIRKMYRGNYGRTIENLSTVLVYLDNSDRGKIASFIVETDSWIFLLAFQKIKKVFNLTDQNLINSLLAESISIQLNEKMNNLFDEYFIGVKIDFNYIIKEVVEITDPKQIEEIRNLTIELERENNKNNTLCVVS